MGAFYQVKEVTFYPLLADSFYHKSVLDFAKSFFFLVKYHWDVPIIFLF